MTSSIRTDVKTAHTPGPWEIDGIAVVGGGQDICFMGEFAQYAGDRPRMAPNHEPNARLIAAAPDLLMAAKAVVIRWDTPIWKDAEHTAQVIDLLREAIAKATGERP